MLQNGKEFLHPEVFETVMTKWEGLCGKNFHTPAEFLWEPAVKLVRIEAKLDTIKFIRDFNIVGYI